MTPARWQQIEGVYESALRLEPERRAAFLEEACGADEQLRREVDSLLAQEERARDYLEVPIVAMAAGLVSGNERLTRLLHYEVLEKLGEGGMGEVYRARDTKLRREVAIKVLPEAFAQDPERLGRFRREARMLAALNHPNIAAIYGLEETDGVSYLVLELVPGETLAERLASGPLSVGEALRICSQVAEALEAAHEKGIIHRDLKPANIKITPQAKVKVLDFGLAKAFSGDEVGGPGQSAVKGTATGEAVIVGTAAYMSPEQARGKLLDKRTDIWSFGCLLYECLAGRIAFPAETVSDTIAAILEHDPEWPLLTHSTPAKIRDLLRRCLQKNPAQRLHDIADARIEIEEALAEPSSPKAKPLDQSRHQGWWGWLPWSLVGLLAVTAAVAVWALWRSSQPSPRPLSRLAINLPQDQSLAILGASVELSPDGTKLLYLAGRGNIRQIYLRPMNQLESYPIEGTEEAAWPFFSPDGKWIAYQSDMISRDGMLRKISLPGGPPQILCDINKTSGGAYFGGCWGPDDTIFYGTFLGLMRVSAAGGVPQAVTTTIANHDRFHGFPQILPGGQAVLFTVGRTGHSRIAVVSLKTGEQRTLIDPGMHARYLPTGHLIYAWEGVLLAVPFDLEKLRVTGSSVLVLKGVMMGAGGKSNFSVSESGSLVYLSGGARQSGRRLVWVDRKGAVEPLPLPPGRYRWAHLSPDKKRLLLNENWDLKVYDLERGTLGRLTDGESILYGVWSPDSQRVVFSSDRDGPLNLYAKRVGGSDQQDRLTNSENHQSPQSWSAHNKVLAFTEWFVSNTGSDIWMLPLEGERRPQPYLQTRFNESQPTFSPDGRWLAYVSDESGRNEVYVKPYPGSGLATQISTEGGMEPLWALDGRELFYRVYRNSIDSFYDYGSSNRVMAVSFATEPTLRVGKPSLLFEGPYAAPFPWVKLYDLAPDGRRFLMIKQTDPPPAPTQINVVLNWFDELQRLVPSGNR